MKTDKIQIEFSQPEFEQLLQLVYLGEWMANAYKAGNEAIDFEETEQLIYAKAYDIGYDDLVEFNDEISGFIPTEKLEDNNQGFIDKYDSKTVIEELAAQLTEREIEELGDLTDKQKEKKRESLFEKYFQILEKSGIDQLELKK